MFFIQMILGSDFINWNKEKSNFQELESGLELALSQKNIKPEVSRLARYFAQNPGAIANMKDRLRVELVATSPWEEGNGDYIEERDFAHIGVKWAKFKRAHTALTRSSPDSIDFRSFSDVIEPSIQPWTFPVNDRYGYLGDLTFKEKIRVGILAFIVPQIKITIPKVIVRREIFLETKRQKFEPHWKELINDASTMARLRRELEEAGIELPRMNPALANLLGEAPPSSRMPTEPAPASERPADVSSS